MEYYKNLSLEDLFYIDDNGLICCEEWRDIVGYEGIYRISNLGRVKSLNYRKTKKEKIKRQANASCGYLNIGLHKNFKQKTILVHRLVAKAFIPNPENKAEVNHKKCNKKHNTFFELEWNTSSENTQHSYENNLSVAKKGIENHYAKLTEKQVLEIRNSTNSQKNLAKEYAISQQQISKIITRTRWEHI